jgi:hypothetical protein
MNTKVVAPGSAIQGNSSASSFREPPSTETDGKTVAMAFLNDAIDSSGVPRKQVADHIARSEPTFSKMTNGTQAFGLDDFERLPQHIQVDWFKRYAERLGLQVREVDIVDLAYQVLTRFDEFAAAIHLLKIRPRMARVSLPVGVTVDRRRA